MQQVVAHAPLLDEHDLVTHVRQAARRVEADLAGADDDARTSALPSR